jgi:hypothetical protein
LKKYEINGRKATTMPLSEIQSVPDSGLIGQI